MRFLLLLAALLSLSCAGVAEAKEPTALDNPLIGQSFGSTDALRWMRADGEPFQFSASPYTLVRWWTNGCPHCSASLPALAALERKYAPRGLRLLAVYHPKGRDLRSKQNIRAYLRRLGFQGDAAYDPRWIKLKDLMARGRLTRATSVSFLVDRHGIVRWVSPGPRLYKTRDPQWAHADRSLRELEALLRRVLKSRPDVSTLLYMRSYKAWRCAPDGSQARLVPLENKPDDTPVWGPGGHRMAFSTMLKDRRHIAIATPDGKTRLYDAGVGEARVESVRWSPNGGSLLFILGLFEGHGCRVFRLDLEGGSVEATAKQDGRDMAACWGPAGRFLAIVTATKEWTLERSDTSTLVFDSAIDVLDRQTGTRKRIVQPERYIFDVAWSPDGRTLAYGSAFGLRLVEADGRNRRVLSKDNISPQPLWSPDGGRVLVAHPSPLPHRSDVGLSWDLAVFTRAGELAHRWRAVGGIYGAAWSPDGKAIAMVRMSKEMRLLRVDARGGEPTMLASELSLCRVSWR